MSLNTHASVHLVGNAPRLEAYKDKFGNIVANADDGPGGPGVSIFMTHEQAADLGRKLLAVAAAGEVEA